MTTEEKIKVMQAFIDGKTIQYQKRLPNSYWVDMNNSTHSFEPNWDFKMFEYRIKPQQKYRPYNSVEEFLQASKEHGPYLKVIDDKGTYKTYILPLATVGAWIDFNGAISDNDIKHEAVAYTKLLGKYIWQDGTPCGILE